MAYCRNCGKELAENENICNACGTAQAVESTPIVEPAPVVEPVQPAQPPVEDNGGFWWGVLGCCIPVVGLILFLVWKDTKPKTSKAAGIGALVSVIAGVLFYVVYIVLMVAVGVGVGLAGY